MADQITLTLPDDLSARARKIAETTSRPLEQVLIDHLKTLATPLPKLPENVQAELDALYHLSDDALWTIAREQLPESIQTEAHHLMGKNNIGTITDAERDVLQGLVERADRLMLRKAEASAILRSRGFTDVS